jgi:predicted nucleic-acid-binding protein
MIGVDTNVLLRFLLRDDPVQSPQAANFFAQRTAGDPAFVSLVTMVETVWNLRRRVPAEQLAATIGRLLISEHVVVQASDLVSRALHDAAGAGADLADAVIAHLGIDADCDYTVTFDRKAAGLPGMLAIGDATNSS